MIEASPRSHDRKAPPTMLDRQVSEKQRTGGNRPDRSVEDAKATALVAELIARARKAQAIANQYDQAMTDLLVAAAGWAIMEPSRNRILAELAVADTGLGNVADKIQKNHRKTLGLLRDLQGRNRSASSPSDKDDAASSRSRARWAWSRRSRRRPIRPRRPRTRSSTRSKGATP